MDRHDKASSSGKRINLGMIDPIPSPDAKRIKLDMRDPIIDVRTINRSFAKIENLEHFPFKVLLNIFTRMYFMDLHNLAESSCRFESIAKIVLNERYTHEHFTIDESKHKSDTYIDFFQRFGSEIKSIYIRNVDTNIDGKDENHWILSVLDAAINLDKLTFHDCYSTNKNLLQNHVNENITHLTLIGGADWGDELVLSKFRKLKRLELNSETEIKFDELYSLVCNNLTLESLVLSDEPHTSESAKNFRRYPFNRLMKLIGTHLKQLKAFAYVNIKCPDFEFPFKPSTQVSRQPDDIVDRFVKSLKQLESLALTKAIDSFTDFNELLRRLRLENSGIKHLKLYDLNAEEDDDSDVFDIVQTFEYLESLVLSFVEFDFADEIVELVKHLPLLRHLEIEKYEKFNDWSFVLVLLQTYPTLEVLTVSSDAYGGELEFFGANKFYNQFIKSIQNPNVKFQVKIWGEIVGTITKDEVIWRKKLLHWTVGCDPTKNLSNIHLLDLAEHQPHTASNAEQRNPFDLILGYLDLKSLHSLFTASKRTLQLVENYMEHHSKQHGIFTITNEFSIMENTFYDGLDAFADYVINLRANIITTNEDGLSDSIEKFNKLNKLYINSKVANIEADDLIVPQVRHLISYDEHFDFSKLYKLSRICPDLETFGTNFCISSGSTEVESFNFRNLKQITFEYCTSDTDKVKKLKALVEHMDTKLIMIY